MINLNDKSILITGGTGSFGKMFTKLILERNPDVKKLVILSRDEQKHFQMAQNSQKINIQQCVILLEMSETKQG